MQTVRDPPATRPFPAFRSHPSETLTLLPPSRPQTLSECVPCAIQRPYECELCPLSFATKQDFTRHLADRHDIGVVLFYCTVPGCTFKPTKRKGSLARHVKNTHGTPDVHACDMCTYTCKNKSDLASHKKLRHSGDEAWLYCDQCPFRTKNAHSLADHKANLFNHVGVTWLSCTRPGCDMQFRHYGQLRAHLKTPH